MPSLPLLATIRQTVPTAPLADVAQAVRDSWHRSICDHASGQARESRSGPAAAASPTTR